MICYKNLLYTVSSGFCSVFSFDSSTVPIKKFALIDSIDLTGQPCSLAHSNVDDFLPDIFVAFRLDQIR